MSESGLHRLNGAADRSGDMAVAASSGDCHVTVTGGEAATTRGAMAARWREPRRREVDAVRLVEVAGPGARDAGVAVLPHDPAAPRVDHDHALAVVVVRRDEPVRQPDRDGLSSRFGPLEAPNDQRMRPERSRMTMRPGSANEQINTRPSGRSCASEGYATGDCSDQMSRPLASSRSIHPGGPISVTRRPPSASGVSPFGLAKPRGGSWMQLPPRTRRTRRAWESSTIRQFRMSATVVAPPGSR
jgi:hypothetical protein